MIKYTPHSCFNPAHVLRFCFHKETRDLSIYLGTCAKSSRAIFLNSRTCSPTIVYDLSRKTIVFENSVYVHGINPAYILTCELNDSSVIVEFITGKSIEIKPNNETFDMYKLFNAICTSLYAK